MRKSYISQSIGHCCSLTNVMIVALSHPTNSGIPGMMMGVPMGSLPGMANPRLAKEQAEAIARMKAQAQEAQQASQQAEEVRARLCVCVLLLRARASNLASCVWVMIFLNLSCVLLFKLYDREYYTCLTHDHTYCRTSIRARMTTGRERWRRCTLLLPTVASAARSVGETSLTRLTSRL